MLETITQMTCEELTGAYVILRELENKTKVLDSKSLACYITGLKQLVTTTHSGKLEDMYKEFLGGRKNV